MTNDRNHAMATAPSNPATVSDAFDNSSAKVAILRVLGNSRVSGRTEIRSSSMTAARRRR